MRSEEGGDEGGGGSEEEGKGGERGEGGGHLEQNRGGRGKVVVWAYEEEGREDVGVVSNNQVKRPVRLLSDRSRHGAARDAEGDRRTALLMKLARHDRPRPHRYHETRQSRLDPHGTPTSRKAV